MKVIPTSLAGCFIIEPTVFKDQRGHFFESFNKRKFKESTGLDIDFVQDNEVFSTYGVIRGLHYQVMPHAQSKLVRCVKGLILDVAVDLRKDSSTYLQHVAIKLDGVKKQQLFVPQGFAHGYSVLSKTALVAYKCDNFHHPESERAMHYLDPSLEIDWKIQELDRLLSAKDK